MRLQSRERESANVAIVSKFGGGDWQVRSLVEQASSLNNNNNKQFLLINSQPFTCHMSHVTCHMSHVTPPPRLGDYFTYV
jgi:hypothetical protein